ncbi:hypothetical protein BvCmsHHP056_04173 [Escherichia coli]|uniref:Uncharacterized protein n=1 Tax=Escherichia coli TaxID=562 RepID=A0A4D2NP63_ECOLX|nr:hypothetical protein CO57_p00240 [Escherichia coli]ANP16067.1 hypothetical protein GJ12_p01105 [Escherichia coli]GCS59850.1 hypothetical protein BvCmsHHP056_04173 [Escherichia coli]GDH49018.1 hypothetical protein BvCmsKKP061_03158 [Escherichia coli]GDN68955.1 hypothetical protein BvCmsNSNP027_00177 [Escherichia coli]
MFRVVGLAGKLGIDMVDGGRRCGNTGEGELSVLSGCICRGISTERKRWIYFVVNINNVSGVIGKSLLKKLNTFK